VDGKTRIAIASASAIYTFGLFEPAQPVEQPTIINRQ
jgi:hypothetical protein